MKNLNRIIYPKINCYIHIWYNKYSEDDHFVRIDLDFNYNVVITNIFLYDKLFLLKYGISDIFESFNLSGKYKYFKDVT